MSKLLEINHCRKSFGTNEVLTDLSLSVEEGQVLSIIGPSGSGKSTLLRCATLLETMGGGDLIYLGNYAARDVDGKAVYGTPAELQKIRGMFGLVFQNFNLFPHYSVLKNVMDAPMLVQKRAEKEVKEEALSLLDQMGLSDKADAYPYQLSGEILRVIRKLAEKKMTMVIVTHEMAFARDVSDWVVFMNGGVIIEQGDPREVIDHPTHERTIQFLRRLQET